MTHVFLFRAVNVGGAKLPMVRLRTLAEELGGNDVKTYIASGNLICTPPAEANAFARALEQAVESEFGFFREVIVRTRNELIEALASHPFEEIEAKYSYITFMRGTPTEAAIAKARTFETGDDLWEIVGPDLHVRYAGGAGRTEMKGPAIMRALGVPMTARNLNTVRALIDLS